VCVTFVTCEVRVCGLRCRSGSSLYIYRVYLLDLLTYLLTDYYYYTHSSNLSRHNRSQQSEIDTESHTWSFTPRTSTHVAVASVDRVGVERVCPFVICVWHVPCGQRGRRLNHFCPKT
jgi:hypothetical protein